MYNCVFKLPMLTAYVTAASVYVILPVQLYDATVDHDRESLICL